MIIKKFRRGDVVKIADDLGPYMDHFPSGFRAVVLYSYSDIGLHLDQTSHDQFSVASVHNGSEVAWYYEHQFEFIKHVGEEGVQEILNLSRAKDKQVVCEFFN